MGRKWGTKITRVLTIILILSLIITNSIKLVESQTEESVKEEQILIISTVTDLNISVSPFTQFNTDVGVMIQNSVGASLYTKYAPLSNGEHDYIPQLAEDDPTISPDGLIFTVKLKPNLRFSNGNLLTSIDVVFSYNLYLTPSINMIDYLQVSSLLVTNASIIEIDKHTIQFEFDHPSILNFEMLTHKSIIESSENNIAKFNKCVEGIQAECDWSDNAGTFMISAGPYVIESHDIENHEIQMVKNPIYHNKQVWADRLIIRGGLEPNSTAEVLKNETDIIMIGINKAIIGGLGNTSYKLSSFPHAGVFSIDLNMQHPVFGTGVNIPDGDNAISSNNLIQAQLVRNALSHVMDRDYFSLELLGGNGDPASAPISNLAVGFNTSIVPHEFSLDTARQYLEQAGFDFNDIIDANGDGDYSDESDTRFFDFTTVTRPDQWGREPFLNYTVDQLSKIGIGLEIDVHTSWNTILPRTFFWPNNTLVPIYDEGGFDAAFWQYSFPQPYSTDYFFTSSELCNSENVRTMECLNYVNYNNAEYDAIVDEFETEGRDWGRRRELMSQIHQILYDDLPSLPIAYPHSILPVKKAVTMPDAKYIDTGYMLWEYAYKEGWKIPTEMENNNDGLDLDTQLIGIAVGIITVSVIAVVVMRRKFFG